MIQSILVGVVLAGALFYLGRMAWRSWQSEKTCDAGCGKCGVINLDKIEAEIKSKGNA